MRRFVEEFICMKLLIGGIIFLVPFLLSVYALCTRADGWILLLFILGAALCTFLLMMLPCLTFVRMIRRQEAMGLPFDTRKLRKFDSDMTSTYLSENWLIHAGYFAMHRSRIASIGEIEGTAARGGISHSIIVNTAEGETWQWRMHPTGIRAVRRWLDSQTNKMKKEK